MTVFPREREIEFLKGKKAEAGSSGRVALIIFSLLMVIFLICFNISRKPQDAEIPQLRAIRRQNVTKRKWEPRPPRMCDELLLPFDLSNGAALNLETSDGYRGARKNPELLQNDTIVRGIVNENEYSFFQLCIESDLHFELSIELKTSKGNPDLYLSLQRPWPSVDNADMISAGLHDEKIVFKSDMDFVQTILGNMESKSRLLLPHVVHLSVFGYEDSYFAVVARLRQVDDYPSS